MAFIEDAQALSNCFKALGDPTRLKILALLREGEKCVCELQPLLGLSQPSVSQHLQKLKRAGLVKEDRRAQWVYYSLHGDRIPFFSEVLRALPELQEAERLQALDDAAGKCELRA